MTISQDYAQLISSQLPLMKSGTLRIWGEWFGRPHDNIHFIVGAEADVDRLILMFNEGETLTVYSPEQGRFSEGVFSIWFATRVRWEWYYYGREHSAASLHFLDYQLCVESLALQTNWRYAKLSGQKPNGPAVELV
ncbi:hypothetical protein AQZ52_09625 [Novosphingobium fuchskuhlense]|uniref:Uncharacterized protein n=1 Tax=Novosphingobium fuchskuhlense TaxID=1117702 RepID=A0A117UVV7_9SPHN|nr:hypothetical protein [Novosphingobium fuchskuhlense]KUR71831.1 hypothetical protein AQZ52_09625 [Novosphingobium fuchskuhlense]